MRATSLTRRIVVPFLVVFTLAVGGNQPSQGRVFTATGSTPISHSRRFDAESRHGADQDSPQERPQPPIATRLSTAGRSGSHLHI